MQCAPSQEIFYFITCPGEIDVFDMILMVRIWDSVWLMSKQGLLFTLVTVGHAGDCKSGDIFLKCVERHACVCLFP